MGYIRSRDFHRTTNKLNFEGFIFVLTHTHNNYCSSASGVLKSYIFVEVMLLEKFENMTPSKITCYTVHKNPVNCCFSDKSFLSAYLIYNQLMPFYCKIMAK